MVDKDGKTKHGDHLFVLNVEAIHTMTMVEYEENNVMLAHEILKDSKAVNDLYLRLLYFQLDEEIKHEEDGIIQEIKIQGFKIISMNI